LDTQNKKSWPEDFKERNYDGALSVDGSIKLRETDTKIWTGSIKLRETGVKIWTG